MSIIREALKAKRKVNTIITHSQKGGPGKTTLACNIAHELAFRGYKTILIDLDVAQPTLHHIFNIPKKKIKSTVNDLLLGKKTIDEEAIILTKTPNLFLLLAESEIAYGEGLLSLLQKIHEFSFFLLHEMGRYFAKMDFDYAVFDCAPGYRVESVNAATMADARVFVIRPSTFSFAGAKEIITDIYKRLDNRPLNYFVFNQIPMNISSKTQKLLEKWRDEIIKVFKPEKIDFLGFLPMSNKVIEQGIHGDYFFPDGEILKTKLKELVDTLIEGIESLRKGKKK
ncbi:MAG: ParA family protein [Candidatus Heimdallarchaeaceae archaeon]